ncbi:MAG: hypothetical protein J7L15_00980 [Clostridiales bacterium]|nr:hypothetical protein [Clostridiales bacterium]
MTKLQKQLENMSVEEKGILLNLLRIQVYPATPLVGNVTFVALSESYNKETNMLLDSLIWRLYGLHYKDYLEHIGPHIGIDPFRLEQALDRSIVYFMEELFNKGKQTVYQF